MTRLSVNVNKVALIRNSRGKNLPDVIRVSKDCERFGAQGITVHPRPDERHIKYQDVIDLKPVVKNEFNIEGYPSRKFLDLVTRVKPHQVTLVPDPPDTLTSDTGWDTDQNLSFLKEVIDELHQHGIRVSIFLNPKPKMLQSGKKAGTDRIELYTEPYVEKFRKNREEAIAPYVETAKEAIDMNLGINAGHDLNLTNLNFLYKNLPELKEVSIGHAIVCDALYYGLENTIQMYLRQLQ